MMRSIPLVFLVFFCSPYFATAQPVAKADANGFQVIAAIVQDEQWREKWYSASGSNGIQFETKNTLARGAEAVLLVGFSSPTTRDGGTVKILCDVKATNSRGEQTASLDPTDCGPSTVSGSLAQIFPTALNVTIVADDTDPLGALIFVVGLTDEFANVRTEVSVSVEIVP